jgi:RecA/RadA recombinase
MAAKKKTQAAVAPAKKTARKKTKVNSDDFLIEDPLANGPVLVGKKFGKDDIKDVLMQRIRDARDSIEKVTHMSKSRPVTLARPSTLRSRTMAFDEPYLEWMFGSSGFHTPKSWEICAPYSAGKSTFAFFMAGRLMLQGCAVLYLECENKRLDVQRAMQLLHPNKEIALLLFNSMLTNAEPITTLLECDNYMETHLPNIRAKLDDNPATAGQPIFVIVDTWTALKNAAEAKGTTDYGVTATSKATKAKDVGEASNLGHAQYASAYRRALPERAKKYNANFIFMTHQQEKINMNAIPGMPPLPKWKNDTSRGGQGLKQLSSYVMTITNAGQITDSARNNIGQRVCFALTKNSFGPPFRRCYASIYTSGRFDNETTHADHFTFADETARWMSDEKLLGTTVRNNLYTCDALGCVAVSADVLYSALIINTEVRDNMMARLGVTGYAVAPNAKILEPTTTIDADEVTDDATEYQSETDETHGEDED